MDDIHLWSALLSPYIHHLESVRRLFGVDLAMLPLLWVLISPGAQLLDLKRIHLLWALFFLKNYPSVALAEEWWGISFKTWQRGVWGIIFLINHYVLNVSFLF